MSEKYVSNSLRMRPLYQHTGDRNWTANWHFKPPLRMRQTGLLFPFLVVQARMYEINYIERQ